MGMEFSVNTNVYEPMTKVVKLNLNTTRHIEQEWLTEAYLQIIDGHKEKKSLGLSAFSASCEKFAALGRAKKGEVALLTQSEHDSGYKGMDALVVNLSGESYKSVEDLFDLQDTVDNFLNIRECVYLDEGKDIWRLLDLSRQDDKKAQRKLRLTIEKKDEKDKLLYPDLAELIKYIVLTPICFRKLLSICN